MFVIDQRSAPPPDFPIVTICEGTLLPGAADTVIVVGFTTSACAETDTGTNAAAAAIRTRRMATERELVATPTCLRVRSESVAAFSTHYRRSHVHTLVRRTH